MVATMVHEKMLKISGNKEFPADIHIDLNILKESVKVLRAINHPFRQDILRLLEENTRMTVTEIYVQLRAEQSVVSQHLGILRRPGIVQTKRDGKHIYYSLNRKRIQVISDAMHRLTRSK